MGENPSKRLNERIFSGSGIFCSRGNKMAFMDFFWKKAKNLANESAEKTVSEMTGSMAEICTRLAEQGECLRRIETRQKETSLQLDELDNMLQNSSDTDLVSALVTLIDIIDDFYYFAAADPLSPLFEQAQMMKNKAISAAENTGLKIIESENEPFDFRFHSAETTSEDSNIPNGSVIKTLKCGYIYGEQVIRRAAVVINKISMTEETTEEDSE